MVSAKFQRGNLRRFLLLREDDVSGVSGTGVVAYGVEFPDGRIAMRWNSAYASTNALDSIKAVETIHGHEGATHVMWMDPGLEDVLAGDAGDEEGSEAQGEAGSPVGDNLATPVVAPWLIEGTRAWSLHNWGDLDECPDHLSLGGLTEEVGELARAIVKRKQGIRGTYAEWTREAEKETGDVLLKLLDVAWRAGVDVNVAVPARWEEISKRDWRANPQGHGISRDDDRPEIVCLCGSTRFEIEFRQVAATFTLNGQIVLMPGAFMNDGHAEKEHLPHVTSETKDKLDELHKRKIDMADKVYVLNVRGYIGDSTRSEIEYAHSLGKPVWYHESFLPMEPAP